MGDNLSTPFIRFKGCNGAWELRRLGSLGRVLTGNTPPTSDLDNWSNDKNGYVWITPTDIDRLVMSSSERHLTDKGWRKGRTIPDNSVLITSIASIGKNAINTVPVAFNQQINAIVPEENDAYFILSAMERDKARFASLAGQTATAIINKTTFEEFQITVSQFDEQVRIGSFFKEFDNLITLQQRKCDMLARMKKSFLAKMFPKDNANVPEVRFAGFTYAWELCRLGDVLVSLQNNTLSRAELCSGKGIALNIHYGDILVKFGECLPIKKEVFPMIADSKVVEKYSSSFLKNGDVIVADTAEDNTAGKCSEIAELTDEIVISGLHTIPYRPLIRFAPYYLGYYMNSNSYRTQLLPLMQGIKVISISRSAMQDTVIRYPTFIEEQQKIGTYFHTLDHLLTLHQRKLKKLQNIKKSLLEKMFV